MATQTKDITYSAGDGITTELVEHQGKRGFAVYDATTKGCTFAEQLGQILPKQNAPWLLPQMPEEFGNDYQLYREIRAFIYDSVELAEESEYDMLAAWVLASYRFMDFDSFPYICAIGPPSSGKTRLIKTLAHLSYRGLFGAGLTASAMFRAIDKDRVSVFLDQAEHLSNSREAPDFLAIVDNGYQKGGKKILTNIETGDYEAFELYSPKAFASTKTLEGTLESRSIRFNMQARTRAISIKLDKARAAALRSKLLLYKFRHAEVAECTEETEAKLMQLTKDGRLIELFMPLYTVTLSSSFPSGTSVPSETILACLKAKNQSRINEEQVSIDAQIIRVMAACEKSVLAGKLSLELLSFEFNCGKPEKEWWKTRTIGKKVRDLGFESCRMSDGATGIYWNEELLKNHKKRFAIPDETPATEKQQTIAVPA